MVEKLAVVLVASTPSLTAVQTRLLLLDAPF
jgi:hypothetical protein